MSAATKTEAAAEARMHELDESAEETNDELGTPLDLLLADAARSPVRRFLPGMSGVRFTTGLARRPRRVAGRTIELATELAKVGVGRSELAAAREGPPLLRGGVGQEPRLQAHAAGLPGARRHAPRAGGRRRARTGATSSGWASSSTTSSRRCAPSNNPFLNPKVLKRMIDTGGGNLLEGGRRFVRDFATAPRVPSMVEPDAFEVGTDIAVTPGAVVLRTDVFELIQYTPQTPKVRSVPLLIVPPTINKYYVIDLAEQRSLVEHLVASRPAGLLHLLAQPGRPARRLGPGHLRPGDHRGDGRPPRRSPARSRSRCSASARAA